MDAGGWWSVYQSAARSYSYDPRAFTECGVRSDSGYQRKSALLRDVDPAWCTHSARQVAAWVALARIAESTGATVEEVGRFVMEFNTMRGAAVKFANGEVRVGQSV